MRITSHPPLLALLLTLAACTQATVPANSQAAGPTPPPSTSPPAAPEPAPAATCPDADFAAFLTRFEGSADVQRASTADPLTMESIDSDATPEPRRLTKQVALAEIEFPILFDSNRRQTEGLQETVTELGPAQREVTHGIPDSDAQIRFEFRADPCWKLVRVSNDMI